jgi:hypothetical protein
MELVTYLQGQHCSVPSLTADVCVHAALKQTATQISQFSHLAHHGSRYEILVSTRGRTAPTARSQRREHGPSLQSVPRNRGGSAKDDCGAQRKVRPLTARNPEMEKVLPVWFQNCITNYKLFLLQI